MRAMSLSRFVAVTLCFACSRSETAKIDTSTPSATPAPSPTTTASTAPASDTMTLVRGTVASVSATQVVVKTDSAQVTVGTPQSVQVFERGPADLKKVARNSFIGVTTVKQPDGSEQATEIHIFPEELRGLGEGSRMMTTSGGTGGRMTNGAVSEPQAAPKMSNGSVASTNGSTLVVQYAGGTTTVTVPPRTPVTEIKPISKTLAAGDQVIVIAKHHSDGRLTSQKVMLSN